MVACTSPSLFAACHVLHRLHAPRHPPCALSSLTIKLAQNKPSCLDQELLQPTCVLSLSSLLSSKAISRNLYLFSCQRSKTALGFHAETSIIAAIAETAKCCENSSSQRHNHQLKTSKDQNPSSSDEFPSIHSPNHLSTGLSKELQRIFNEATEEQ